MDAALVYIMLAAIFGLFMAWGIGANDVANAMATSVGSRAITIRQALLIAAVFEFTGAVLAGGEVTSTIRKGIVDASSLGERPEELIFGMLAALLAAGTWLLIASRKGWPVSTTHSIVGAIIGFAVVGIGMDAVKWSKVVTIVASWVASPLIAGLFAFVIFSSVQWLILSRSDPLERARRYVPVYIMLTVFMISLVTLFKGLKHLGLTMTTAECYLMATGLAAIAGLVGKLIVGRIKPNRKAEKKFHFYTVERVFAVLMVFTACSMAFAHGSNDVANAIGPVAAVVSIARSGLVGQQSPVSIWILLLGGVGIVAGLATYGRHVIATVGKQITELTPSRGFAAELAAASTIVLASGTGIPISTTHTLVGAILGVGMARGIAAIDLGVVGRILVSWIVTIPAGAGLAVLFFLILRVVFS
ncbi:MAG TPA: inorganic phosphate transporter [Chromatiales bacterium]|nr:inorganic phosphate transporter [Chromatiales bacterium]